MSSNSDIEANSRPGFDPLIQIENGAFDRAEMIACSHCKRANPPNRFKCLYCAGDLELSSPKTDAINIVVRKPESWERCVNIILQGVSAAADTKQAATLLSVDHEDIVRIVGSGKGLPLGRVESTVEADAVVGRLRGLGIDCFAVNDEILAVETPNIRIGGLEFLPGEFAVKNFNTGIYTRFPAYEIALIVVGVISKTKVDSVEKRRLRGESKLIDQSSLATDERVLDIYPSNHATGFRLSPTGFDFSCLGDQKSLLARENWGRLIDLLKTKLPSAEFVTDYPEIREALETAWPSESRTESKGMIQTGFGKREFGSVAKTSNLEQFNRYSRLQRYLYETKR